MVLLTPHEKQRLGRISLTLPTPHKRPWRLSERLFTVSRWLTLGLVVFFALWDSVRSGVGSGPMPLGNASFFAWLVLLAGLSGVAFVFLDLATYKPRLFALADFTGPSGLLFAELATYSKDLEHIITEIKNTPARSWAELKGHEENLIIEANNYYLLDKLRASITLRILFRLLVLILALSLCAYAATAIRHGNFVANMPQDAGMVRHMGFTVISFFNIGYGDSLPTDGVGYTYLALSAFLLVATFYFVIADIVASYFEFQTNIKTAAHNFVASLARF
jgi:hypothetical protein